ncbi:MAG: YfhO family protein [Acetatifactor sp.]
MKKTKKYVNAGTAPLLLSFLLPLLIMLALFIVNGIYPFGDRSFLSGDLYHQYMPFFSELLHKIRDGESLYFSFHVGIGSNFLALFVYYLASPLHILALLVPESHLIEFIGYLIVVKVGLCGLTACIYLRRHFDTKEWGTVLFSCFYALSGFMAAYNYNIMWVDCVVLLPLIVLGLERLVKEGKWGLYCVTLALSIFTNYYISIMICIFLMLYFCLLLVTEKKRLRSIGYFALFSLLAGGMAAVLLIPEVCAIIQTDFGDMDFPKEIESYFPILDVLARHCMCVFTERGLEHWPNIYCGSAVIMLIPMYLMNRRISIREKFCRMALAGFLLLSFSTNILDFIWHGLNYPDSLPARQSFLYIFMVLVMCYEAYHHVKEVDSQQIVYGYLVSVGFFLFCEKFVEHEDFEPGVKLLTFMFVTLYAVLLYLYRTRESLNARKGIAIVAFAAVIAECGINTWDTSIATTSRSAYLGQQEDYKALYELTKAREESFYRLEKFERKTKNDGTLTGYPTASVFSSTMNSYVMDMYKKLGMRHSKVFYGFDGATALTSALLNVNYMFGDSEDYENSLYSCLAQSGDVYLYACNAVLPFGYVAPTGFELPEGTQAIRLQNELIQELGIDGKLFVNAGASDSEDDVKLTAKESGIYYAILTAGGTGKVTYIGGSTVEETFSDLKNGSILYLGYLEQGQKITLTNGDDEDETPAVRAEIYRMDEEVLYDALHLLSEQHMEKVEWESDRISGEITMQTAGRLILSIPYEDGWKIFINGEEAEGELFGGCLMAFDLEPGEYRIEMHYVPKGFYAGIGVSVVSIAGFLALVLLRRKKDIRE